MKSYNSSSKSSKDSSKYYTQVSNMSVRVLELYSKNQVMIPIW